jgi:hypothetical protein
VRTVIREESVWSVLRTDRRYNPIPYGSCVCSLLSTYPETLSRWRWQRSGILLCAIALMMEAVSNSETSVYFNEITWRCMPEGCRLQARLSENLKSRFTSFFIFLLSSSSSKYNAIVTWHVAQVSLIWKPCSEDTSVPRHTVACSHDSHSLGPTAKRIMFSHHVSLGLYVNCSILLIKGDNFACSENTNPPTVVISDKTNGCVF